MYELKIQELIDAGYVEVRDNDPLKYCPIENGIGPSTSKVPKLEGKGVKSQIIQLDDMAQFYINSKRSAREILGVSKLYQRTEEYTKQHEKALCDFLLKKMTTEYPTKFRLTKESEDVWALLSWTGEAIEWHPETLKIYDSKYYSLTDALCCQIQEDVVMMTKNPIGNTIATMIHLHHPNGWAANTHIGLNFEQIHQEVKHSSGQLVVKRPTDFANIFVSVKGSFERVGAISFRGAGVLCRHPEDTTIERSLDNFNEGEPRAIMRFERQTITGFPEHNSFIFTIKTYMSDVFKEENREMMKVAFSNIHPDAYSRWYLDLYAEKIKTILNK